MDISIRAHHYSRGKQFVKQFFKIRDFCFFFLAVFPLQENIILQRFFFITKYDNVPRDRFPPDTAPPRRMGDDPVADKIGRRTAYYLQIIEIKR